MTPEAERVYVRQWAETGRMLEAQRWDDVRALDDASALRASSALIEAALRIPLPARRRGWSGLVDLQDRLHGRRNGTHP